MRNTDVLKLAKTKFRIRRIRLTIGIIILVLLFSAVLSAFVTMSNIRASIKGYANFGINGRYLISAHNKKPNDFYGEDPPQELIDLAVKYYNEAIAKEKAAYQKLGYTYTEDPSRFPYTKEKYNNEEHIWMNTSSPYTEQAITEYLKQFPDYTKDDLANLTAPYHPLAIHTVSDLSITSGRTLNYANNTEDFSSLDPNYDNYGNNPLDHYFDSVGLVDDSITSAYLIENYQLESDEIPIVINVNQAEHLLELKPLDASHTDQQKWERLNYIRANANAQSYQVCHRNSASLEQVTNAYLANANRNTKITYNMPAAACDLPTIKSDSRTAAEKATAEQQALQQTLIQKELGTYTTPQQQIIKYRIVGIVPADRSTSSHTADALSLLQQLTNSRYLPYFPQIPKNLLENNFDTTLFSSLYSKKETGYEALFPKTGYIVEFETPENAQSFLANHNCGDGFDPCTPTKPFRLNLFGNNSILVDQLFNNIANILIGALLVIAIIAFIILFNIINRILADSQKETAVFRAIGYRKSHITRIYLTYIAIYSLIVFTLTLLITSIVPWVLNALFSQDLGTYFSVFFNATELTPFNFASFEPLTLLTIIPIFLIGILSAIIPLAINSRRNIIKNLRQE